jgi:signal transduction histidine kinase
MRNVLWLLVYDVVGAIVVAGIFVAFSDDRSFGAYALAWCTGLSFALPNTFLPYFFFRFGYPRLVSAKPAVRAAISFCTVLVGAVVSVVLATSLWVGLGVWPASEWGAGLGRNLFFTLVVAHVQLGVGWVYLRSRRELDRANQEVARRALAHAESLTALATAQLQSLESRLRPHFLFNALNATLSLIPEQPARAEAMLERIAALLRFSLDADLAGLVPLREELRMVEDYLAIEGERFGDRLVCRFDVDEESLDLELLQVPPFALQTLVENALKHAIARQRHGGRVAVSVRRQPEQRVRLSVEDNGPGFGGRGRVPGHGLDDLASRLALHFGDASWLSLEDAHPGARVTFELPLVAGAALS